MRICFVIPGLSNSGGMERVMSQIVNYVAENKNDELHLLMYGAGCEKIFFDISKKVTIHIPQFKYSAGNRRMYAIKALKFIRQTVKHISPDTILSFGEIWNNFVLLALYGLKYPIYISDRCRPNKSFGRFHDTLRKWLYPKSTGVIAQTEKAKQIYLTQFKHDNIVVIGNPIRQIEDRGIARENIVVSVGRLIDTKNFDQLIDIFAKIDAPDWKLVIVGGDANQQTNMSKLQKQIDDCQLNARVILAGQKKDVESYLLKSKIFAFTSSSEGFPNVIGEAMSAGLPVVAYDCIAGPSDMVIDGENGFLIPLFDQSSFKQRLSQLIKDESLRNKMGHCAKTSICRFGEEFITEQYYEVITRRV